jgi:hypothetical protein
MNGRGDKVNKLAEAIMLQAIEDLWIATEKESCITFFTGKEFHICAEMAAMDFDEKVGVFDLVSSITRLNTRTNNCKNKQLKTGNYEEKVFHIIRNY